MVKKENLLNESNIVYTSLSVVERKTEMWYILYRKQRKRRRSTELHQLIYIYNQKKFLHHIYRKQPKRLRSTEFHQLIYIYIIH